MLAGRNSGWQKHNWGERLFALMLSTTCASAFLTALFYFLTNFSFDTETSWNITIYDLSTFHQIYQDWSPDSSIISPHLLPTFWSLWISPSLLYCRSFALDELAKARRGHETDVTELANATWPTGEAFLLFISSKGLGDFLWWSIKLIQNDCMFIL